MKIQVYTENEFLFGFINVERIVLVEPYYISVKIKDNGTFRSAYLDPDLEGKIIEIRLMED